MTGTASPPPSVPSDDIRDAMRVAQGARTKPKLAITIIAIIAITVVTAGWFAGWFAPTPPVVAPQTCAGHVELAGAGASVVTPAMRTWTAQYNTTVCAKVTYATDSSGIAALANKSVDFAAIDAPFSPAESTELGAGAIVLPVALEAVAVVYNVPGVPSGLHLSGTVLAAMFLGNITNWNSSAIQALNPQIHLPMNLDLVPVHCMWTCSTNLLFTGYLSRSNATWNTTVGTSADPSWPNVGDNGSGSVSVLTRLNETPGGIAYAELPLVQQANLTWASLENPHSTFVAPSAANTTAAASSAIPVLPPETGVPTNESLLDEAGNSTYPMATLSYLVIYQDLGVAYGGSLTKNTAQWLGAYALWIGTAAQGRGTALGYAPLPAVLTTWNVDSLEKLQWYGQSVLAGGDFDGGL
ncbi:MAG: phosphate ABC transporter substrate-binding protein PstS [Thermoplasmata archaeon]